MVLIITCQQLNLRFYKKMSSKIYISLFNRHFQHSPPLSLSQETFCFCARQRCNSSNSPPSPNPLLFTLASFLALCCFKNSPLFVRPTLLCPCLVLLHTCLSYASPCILLLLSPIFLVNDLGNSVRDLQSTIFNIPPWRSFNISPTARNFRRLSELRRAKRETPVISPTIQIIMNYLSIFISYPNDQDKTSQWVVFCILLTVNKNSAEIRESSVRERKIKVKSMIRLLNMALLPPHIKIHPTSDPVAVQKVL